MVLFCPILPSTMSKFHFIFLTWVIMLSLSSSVVRGGDQCFSYQYLRQTDRKLDQKTNQFWMFDGQSNSWVEVKLPYDLSSCINGTCTKVGSIDRMPDIQKQQQMKGVDASFLQEMNTDNKEGNSPSLPLRKRISLIKMSDTSIWVTGESGSIYERFWNGLLWVIAPHDLPVSAGYAKSVFIAKHTILALSEAGILYQLQLSENSHPVWMDFSPKLNQITSKGVEQNSSIPLKSGVISHDRERIYFCTKNGSLLEFNGIETPRWVNHGRPPGADVAAIAVATIIRDEVIFTTSSAGYLYEYDRRSKPAWRKHIWKEEGAAEHESLIPSTGCALQGLSGDHFTSIFLLTKSGNLVERRLQKKKWRWIRHGSPNDHQLTAIALPSQDDQSEKSYSLFLTTISGFLFEYQMQKQPGIAPENQILGNWVNHMHPPHAKVARGIPGVQLQIGRIIFPLDDGRLAELHPAGLGGETSGPTIQVNPRRKTPLKFVWTIIDVPETEGWNAEYCSEERGPTNCITGVKDESSESGIFRALPGKRKGRKEQEAYLSSRSSDRHAVVQEEKYSKPDNLITSNFRLRLMHEGRSFFLITDGGWVFECLHAENMWLWLRHEHSTSLKGALGNYNGSIFLVDEHGSLLIRERNSNELQWINCTAFRKGRHVIGGPPWDEVPGRRAQNVIKEDALFFVSKSGRLLQFTVAQRKFKWKDCRTPPNSKISSIVDQEVFRENIVFVIGTNGRLYQYNKVTELWHEHYQSQHLILSRVPGASMRPSRILSLTGSLFMLSESGGLVEYHWNSLEGWNWVEHGTPYKSVTLVGSPGPCFEGNQLFLIGSDGKVYLRYLNQGAWKWRNYGFPYVRPNKGADADKPIGQIIEGVDEVCMEHLLENTNADNENCDLKVASTRPVPFTGDSVIFELIDGRLAEMQRVGNVNWVWSRIIDTPTSLCTENYWTAVAS